MPDIPEIQKIAGPPLLAIIFSYGLLGILTVQVYLYHVSFPKDRTIFKIMVFAVYFLEALQTCLLTEAGFLTLAVNFADPLALDHIGIDWFSVSVLCGIVASISQSFYAYRLFMITQSKVLTGIIILLSFTQLGGALADAAELKKSVLFTRFFSNTSTDSFIATTIWGTSSAACDVLIAIFMSSHLRRYETDMKQTQDILSRIIRLSIQTGIFTATMAIFCTALIYLPGHPTYYQAAITVVSKAYSMSMLVVLNSRVRVFSPPILVWNEEQIQDNTVGSSLDEMTPSRSSLRFTTPFVPRQMMININANEIELNANEIELNTMSYGSF